MYKFTLHFVHEFFLFVAVKAHLADEKFEYKTVLGISELGECHWF